MRLNVDENTEIRSGKGEVLKMIVKVNDDNSDPKQGSSSIVKVV